MPTAESFDIEEARRIEVVKIRYGIDGKVWHGKGCCTEHSPICTCGLLDAVYHLMNPNEVYPRYGAEITEHLQTAYKHWEPAPPVPDHIRNGQDARGFPMYYPGAWAAQHKANCPCYDCHKQHQQAVATKSWVPTLDDIPTPPPLIFFQKMKPLPPETTTVAKLPVGDSELYEARLLACRLHAYRLKSRAVSNQDRWAEENIQARLTYLNDLARKIQIAGTADKLTGMEMQNIDVWYAQAKQEGRIVGAAPEPPAEAPPATEAGVESITSDNLTDIARFYTAKMLTVKLSAHQTDNPSLASVLDLWLKQGAKTLTAQQLEHVDLWYSAAMAKHNPAFSNVFNQLRQDSQKSQSPERGAAPCSEQEYPYGQRPAPCRPVSDEQAEQEGQPDQEFPECGPISFVQDHQGHAVPVRIPDQFERQADAEQAEQNGQPADYIPGLPDEKLKPKPAPRQETEQPISEHEQQWEAKNLKEICHVRLKQIDATATQLTATVKQNLKHYREYTVPALAEQYNEEVSKILTWATVKNAIARMEVDLADLHNAHNYANDQFEFSSGLDYSQDDLEDIKETEKELLELADRVHGIEKIPEAVAALTEADSGYHIGS